MNKRAIWFIIVLMSVGLIGTIVIQIYWFRSAIDIQETNFDDNVFEALNEVDKKLIAKEKNQAINNIPLIGQTNPRFLKQELELREEATGDNLIDETEFKYMEELFKNDDFIKLIEDTDDPWRIQRWFMEVKAGQRYLDPPDIENRLVPADLSVLLKQELADRGIKMHFNSGVYSTKSNSFVILNDNFAVNIGDDGQSNFVDLSEKNLIDTKYSVQLFSEDKEGSPAALKVQFPNKGSWLWRSLLPMLFSTIAFTGLILFCFSYTISVIFRQKKISEMKTDFINNMTHEFKTPIATISLASDSITSPMVISDQFKIKRFAGIIKQENKRMLSQVEKVLQMALIDKQDFQLKLSDVNMHEIIAQAIENANLQVQKRGGYVSKDLQANKPLIKGDVTHLSNVIHNLLDNANKYSPESPEISVETRNVKEGIQVIVTDKGIGMSKEARKQIFDKFYRVSTGNLHDVKGFGLGLSYVKAITDAHNGAIDVKSEVGKGSSFILYFPFKNQNGQAAA